MNHLIEKEGLYNHWLLPEKLYHGTTDMYLDSIVTNGLKISHEQKNSALSLPNIYLTSSMSMAKGFAKSVAFHKSGNPIILEINTNELKADSIGFDLNICLKICSQCIVYQENIQINQKNIIRESELEKIEELGMIFKEPDNIMVPVIWNLHEKETQIHLEKIGYKKEPEINIISGKGLKKKL